MPMPRLLCNMIDDISICTNVQETPFLKTASSLGLGSSFCVEIAHGKRTRFIASLRPLGLKPFVLLSQTWSALATERVGTSFSSSVDGGEI